MRSFRVGPNEIAVSMDIKNAVWLISQMTILAEHYELVEETALAKKCEDLAASLKQSLARKPPNRDDHD